jgi:hypothetical protein
LASKRKRRGLVHSNPNCPNQHTGTVFRLVGFLAEGPATSKQIPPRPRREPGVSALEIASSQTLEEAVNIAWVYLQKTGDLGDGGTAAVFLTNTIESMMRRGQRNRMFLANKAIIKYRAFRENSKIIPIREYA